MKSSIFLVVLALILAAGSQVWASPGAGFVAAVRGEVSIERGTETHVARIGFMVQAGDVLLTGPKSRLKVLLSDDSVLALGSKSRLEIKRHLFEKNGKRSTSLRLVRGQVRALVHKLVADKKPDFEVRTRTAVAGVRGTEFALDAGADGQGGRLVTFSGSVLWGAGESEPILVAAGEASQATEAGVDKPVALAAADLRAIRNETDTKQAPTALAWNLPMDKLGPGGPGPVMPDDGDDRDSLEENSESGSFDSGGVRDPAVLLDYPSGSGGRNFNGELGVDDGTGDGLLGDWEQPVGTYPVNGGMEIRVLLNRRP
ncbi:MAG: FecR domain-containing protein [Deltaproteobacteria bacterium]|nr:FecR domain-containing protein [Deltaproteobacteria bacterium]